MTGPDGNEYRLTKHGRARYLQRVNADATDTEILLHAIKGDPNFTFVWGEDWTHKGDSRFKRLVTVQPTSARVFVPVDRWRH